MDSKTQVLWVYAIHDKVRRLHHSFQEGLCPECAFFAESRNFKDPKIEVMSFRQKFPLFNWGLCGTHIEMVTGLYTESEELHFFMERRLGAFEEGFFRTLPDGRACSIRTGVWRDYLLSLCNTPPS